MKNLKADELVEFDKSVDDMSRSDECEQINCKNIAFSARRYVRTFL